MQQFKAASLFFLLFLANLTYAQRRLESTKTKMPPVVVIQQHIEWGATGKRCQLNGLYCYQKPTLPKPGDCISRITLTGGNIQITTTGQNTTVARKTIEAFKNKKIEMQFEDIPSDYYKTLFESIGLRTPDSKISFNAREQSYRVVDKPRSQSVIEVYQKTKIIIRGKTYNLTIITRSGEI